jgi:hypothetical protein
MKHYAGLDVLVKETSVCIVDETGKICREVKVSSHPGDLVKLLQDPVWHLARIGLEGTSNRCVIGILRRPYCAGCGAQLMARRHRLTVARRSGSF